MHLKSIIHILTETSWVKTMQFQYRTCNDPSGKNIGGVENMDLRNSQQLTEVRFVHLFEGNENMLLTVLCS